MVSRFVLLLFLGVPVLSFHVDTIFPSAVFGLPLNGTVMGVGPLDFTGQDTFRIDAWVRPESGKDVKIYIHRTYPDFQHFDSLKPWYIKFKLPAVDLANRLALNDYLQRVFLTRSLVESELFADFMGINWDGSETLYMRDFATFMRMLTQDRIPMFPPEPPIFATEADAVVERMCPFENYVFLKSFRNDDIGLDAYLEYYGQYVDTLPAFEGEPDDSDVWLPGAREPVYLPYHYLTTQVHFNPGGYVNGRTARMSFSTQNKFNFLMRDNLKEWFGKLHGHRNPKKILDIGTGNGFSAIELALLFPEAEVHGVDMAAPYVRFARAWKKALGIENVFFYQGNGESMPSIESETYDLVQYTYVVHEMPFENAKRFLHEAMRILKPGGVLSGFEVTYWQNDLWRLINIERNTWGAAWNDTALDTVHGPEPYMEEYQDKTKLPLYLADMGFVDPTDIRYCNFDSIYVVHKPAPNPFGGFF